MRKSRDCNRRFLNKGDPAGAAFLCPAFFLEIGVTSSLHTVYPRAGDNFSPRGKTNSDIDLFMGF
jgi:hypothetical protein